MAHNKNIIGEEEDAKPSHSLFSWKKLVALPLVSALLRVEYAMQLEQGEVWSHFSRFIP